MSAEEAWLSALEEKAKAVELELPSLTQRAVQLAGWGREVQTQGRITPPCVLYFVNSKVFSGCDGTTGIPGATVTVTGHTSGIVGGTFTADGSGHWGGTVVVSAFDTSVDITYHAPPRFADFTGNLPVTCGNTYTIANGLSAATNYKCVGGCYLPLKTPLSASDTFFGSFTFPANSFASNNKLVNYAGGGSSHCAPVNNVPVQVILAPFSGNYNTAEWTYIGANPSLGCSPVSNCCPAVPGAGTQPVAFSTIGGTLPFSSGNCPPSFQAVFTWSDTVYWNTSGTLTITEAP